MSGAWAAEFPLTVPLTCSGHRDGETRRTSPATRLWRWWRQIETGWNALINFSCYRGIHRRLSRWHSQRSGYRESTETARQRRARTQIPRVRYVMNEQYSSVSQYTHSQCTLVHVSACTGSRLSIACRHSSDRLIHLLHVNSRNVRRILVRGVDAPLPPETKKNWKFDYEMVHSGVYQNKYVVSVEPFSTPACPDCSQNITLSASTFNKLSWQHVAATDVPCIATFAVHILGQSSREKYPCFVDTWYYSTAQCRIWRRKYRACIGSKSIRPRPYFDLL